MAQIKLKPKVKSLITKALRGQLDGVKYIQAIGKLHTPDNKFCVLGVICDVHHKYAPKKDRAEWEVHNSRDAKYYHGEAFGLPRVVSKWLGIEYTGSLKLEFKGNYESIMALNDTYKLSFNELADMIEEQL